MSLCSVQLGWQDGRIPELVVKNISPKYFQILMQDVPFSFCTEINPKLPPSPPQQNIGVGTSKSVLIELWVLNIIKS